MVEPAKIARENSPTPVKPIFDKIKLLAIKKNNAAVKEANIDFFEIINKLFKYGSGPKRDNLFFFHLSKKEKIFLLEKYNFIKSKKHENKKVNEYK